MQKTSVANTSTLIAVAATLLAGCASRHEPQDTLQLYDKRASLASSLLTLSGYEGVISDSGYSSTLDAAINAGTMARLLPGDTGLSSFSAAGLGFALTALQGTYPVDNGFTLVMLQPVSQNSDVTAPDFVQRTVEQNLEVKPPVAATRADLAASLKKSHINQIKCQPYSAILNKADYNYECKLPYIRWSALIRVGGIYEGSLFNPVMPSVAKGKYAVLFVSSGQLQGKAGSENVFAYQNGVFENSIAVLPFVMANDAGKHLVYLHGKATLI